MRRAAVRVCPGCGAEFRGVKDTKRKKQYYCSHNCYLRCRRVSHFENSVIDMIEAAGYKVERQAKRGRWSFDAAIVGSNILVEADGVYWHSSATVKARDARKNAWAAQQGYILIRVPEMDFRDNPSKAIDVILRRAEAEGLECELISHAL
jgi:very-short-patch-repair endonuclease